MTNAWENGAVIRLSGRIDSNNAGLVEKEIQARLAESGDEAVVLDAEDLDYISSAGLRVILRLKKTCRDLKIVRVGSEVYEILEMTGFTEMMPVEKAYRVVSVEGCEVVGEGANGRVYRIDQDNVVKVYKNADALSDIQHEREVARLALILGVPTAISYDVVRVGDSYGSVFELLNARSFAKILAEEPERMDWCVGEYVDMLKKLHAILVPAGKLPSIREKTLERVRRMKDALPEALADKLERMVEDVPESDRMIHGDYHTKNIVLAGDEVLLIDMDTLSVGQPLFELAQMYNAYVGFSEYDPDVVRRFQGYDAAVAREFWRRSLKAYLGTEDAGRADEVEKKVRCVAYALLIDWQRRHTALEKEGDRAALALWVRELTALLEETDSLDLRLSDGGGAAPDELDIEAATEKLPQVAAFVESRLEAIACPMKAQRQIEVAVEEIFVNIARYAYAPGTGRVTVRVETAGEPASVSITFIDRGVPYDPLAKNDPDVSLPAGKREIGGLGIFMTKKLMDDVAYVYKDGRNILTLKKSL